MEPPGRQGNTRRYATAGVSGKATPVSSSESSHSRARGLGVARGAAAPDDLRVPALLGEAVGPDVRCRPAGPASRRRASAGRPSPRSGRAARLPMRHQRVLDHVLRCGAGGWSRRSRGARRPRGRCEPASSRRRWSSSDEEQVGELGLAVGAPARVAAVLPVEVVEVDLADTGARPRTRSTTRSRDVRAAGGWSARSGRGGWCRSASRSRPRCGARGTAMTPALLMRTSRSPSQASANARTEAEVGEVELRAPRRRPSIDAAAASPLAVSRTASTTRAPARASSRAAARPMPLLAPVTTKVRPSRSGRSCAVHLAEVMRPK